MSDMQAATDLELYIANDDRLYEQITSSILKNLAAKKARGVYRHDLAVKGFGHLVEAGAKKYVKEFGISGPWHKMFDVSTRKRVVRPIRPHRSRFHLQAQVSRHGTSGSSAASSAMHRIVNSRAFSRKKSGRAVMSTSRQLATRRGGVVLISTKVTVTAIMPVGRLLLQSGVHSILGAL